MKKLLIASALSALLAAPAIAGPAEAAPSHKNMCSGIVSDGSGNLDKGALTLYWSLSNLHVNASDQTHNFRVKGIHGQIGVSDMTILGETADGSSARFLLPLDGLKTRGQPDTIALQFTDGTTFVGVCAPIK